MEEILAEFRNADVSSGGKTVLKEINWQLRRGNHKIITGAGGAGKTILLNALAGRAAVTRGSFTMHVRPAYVEARHGFKNLAGMQAFYAQQRFNATESDDAETVNLYLTRLATGAGAWTVERAMTVLRLDDLQARHVIKLSNGQTRRLMIAAALVKNPQVILLDAPLNGLDVPSRRAFNELLQEIANTGITLVMTAGHEDEWPAIFQEVTVLENGRISYTGPATQFKPKLQDSEEGMTLDKEMLTGLVSGYVPGQWEYLVQVNNAHVAYNGMQVLKGITWSIRPGEHQALLGENGAGKSTLLSLINGDNPQAYANDIWLFGRKRGNGESIWDIKRNTGYVSPELLQYFPQGNTCLQVVESGYFDTVGLFRKCNASQHERALKWMRLLGIEGEKQVLLKNASAGVQRLCLLARAMVKNPPLLILDEPVQGMDGKRKRQFKQLLEQVLAQSGTTLIYVTHYADEIPNIVKYTLRLREGMMV